MKKLTALLLLMITVWSLASLPATQIASARPIHSIQTVKKTADKLVYTKGTTYHRSCCRHIGFTKPTTLTNAQKKNYTPCKVCNP